MAARVREVVPAESAWQALAIGAQKTKAFAWGRKIASPVVLLRLVLAYCLGKWGLRSTTAWDPHDPGYWEPPIVKTVAVRDEGVAELLDAVERHRTHLETTGERRAREVARARASFVSLLRERLLAGALERLAAEQGRLDDIAARIADREADPFALADELAARLQA